MKKSIRVWLVLFVAGLAAPAVPTEQAVGGLPEVDARPDTSSEAEEPAAGGLPRLDEKATLDDYLAYAALNNVGLDAAYSRWQSVLERASAVGVLPDPKLSYTYFVENVETRVGPQLYKLMLAQTIPWFGTLGLRRDVVSQEAEVARERYELEKLKLYFRVKRAFYDFYYLGRSVVITRENMRLLEYWEEVARARYRSAAGGHPDVIKAQVELGKLVDRLRTAEESLAPIRAELNAALSRPVDAPLATPASPGELGAIEVPEEELLASLRRQSPKLRALAFEITKQEKREDLARKSYFPAMTLAFEYVGTGEALDPLLPDSGKDAMMAKVSINVPIWFGKYRSQVNEARAQASAARKTLEDEENNLEAALKMALFRYQDADRKIDLFRDTLVPKGKQSLKAIESAYRAGGSDFLSLIDAQRLLLEFELSYEKALADYGRSLAEIEMIVGREPPAARAAEDLSPREER